MVYISDSSCPLVTSEGLLQMCNVSLSVCSGFFFSHNPGSALFALGLFTLAGASHPPCYEDSQAAHVAPREELRPPANSHEGSGLCETWILQLQNFEVLSN